MDFQPIIGDFVLSGKWSPVFIGKKSGGGFLYKNELIFILSSIYYRFR
jgi:hypothetical protein